MKARTTVALVSLASGLSGFVGIVSGRLLYATDLADCRNRVYTAELTQDGSAHMMEACLDQQERLDVCELGMHTADGLMEEGERERAMLRARLMIAKAKCDTTLSSEAP